MHPNKNFRGASKEDNIEFARLRSFGILSVNAESGPLISHIPFQLSKDGSYLEAHLVKSNPIIQQLSKPTKAVMVVSGADAYISPDWYKMNKEQVPTWNYLAVHLRGELRQLESGELHGILDRLSANMENRLEPKPPWKISKLDKEAFTNMQKHIIPIALDVTEINGTWKLSQNKAEEARISVADALDAGGVGSELSTLSKLIRSSTST